MNDTIQRPFTAFAFNQYLAEKKLMAAWCSLCEGLYLPPRAICPKCHNSQMEWVETSGKGKLAAFTSVYIGPSFMNEQGFGRDNPYLSGVVELQEGVKISARIIGLDPKAPGNITIGIPMEVDFLEVGEGVALAFRVRERGEGK